MSGEEYVTALNASAWLDVALLSLLLVIGLAIIAMRDLFSAVMLAGAYSLVSAAFFVVMDAVDVAFTEAAVGAGISTVLMLSAMLLTARKAHKPPPGRAWTTLVVVLAAGAVLVYATVDMPAFGDPNSPANAYVGKLYLQQTPTDISVPNVVTAVLASYRGFDTFGEVVVIFTAGLGVMLLLGLRAPVTSAASTPAPPTPVTASETAHHSVLRVVSKTLIPFIALYAFYVQFHGDYGPGGGFQAGVILAASVILYALIYGVDEARRAVPPWLVRAGCAAGVLLYGGVGVATLLGGDLFLAYDALKEDAHNGGQHLGILLVELGVLITVTAVMLAIFYAFAGRTPDIADEDW